VSAQDPHAPTHAGPTPEPEPTPVVGPDEASAEHPAGTAAPGATPAELDPHPEKRVGAAFAGGLVAALFLKRLADRRHR
jgi:hypothetical protein